MKLSEGYVLEELSNRSAKTALLDPMLLAMTGRESVIDRPSCTHPSNFHLPTNEGSFSKPFSRGTVRRTCCVVGNGDAHLKDFVILRTILSPTAPRRGNAYFYPGPVLGFV